MSLIYVIKSHVKIGEHASNAGGHKQGDEHDEHLYLTSAATSNANVERRSPRQFCVGCGSGGVILGGDHRVGRTHHVVDQAVAARSGVLVPAIRLAKGVALCVVDFCLDQVIA